MSKGEGSDKLSDIETKYKDSKKGRLLERVTLSQGKEQLKLFVHSGNREHIQELVDKAQKVPGMFSIGRWYGTEKEDALKELLSIAVQQKEQVLKEEKEKKVAEDIQELERVNPEHSNVKGAVFVDWDKNADILDKVIVQKGDRKLELNVTEQERDVVQALLSRIESSAGSHRPTERLLWALAEKQHPQEIVQQATIAPQDNEVSKKKKKKKKTAVTKAIGEKEEEKDPQSEILVTEKKQDEIVPETIAVSDASLTGNMQQNLGHDVPGIVGEQFNDAKELTELNLRKGDHVLTLKVSDENKQEVEGLLDQSKDKGLLHDNSIQELALNRLGELAEEQEQIAVEAQTIAQDADVKVESAEPDLPTQEADINAPAIDPEIEQSSIAETNTGGNEERYEDARDYIEGDDSKIASSIPESETVDETVGTEEILEASNVPAIDPGVEQSSIVETNTDENEEQYEDARDDIVGDDSKIVPSIPESETVDETVGTEEILEASNVPAIDPGVEQSSIVETNTDENEEQYEDARDDIENAKAAPEVVEEADVNSISEDMLPNAPWLLPNPIAFFSAGTQAIADMAIGVKDYAYDVTQRGVNYVYEAVVGAPQEIMEEQQQSTDVPNAQEVPILEEQVLENQIATVDSNKDIEAEKTFKVVGVFPDQITKELVIQVEENGAVSDMKFPRDDKVVAMLTHSAELSDALGIVKGREDIEKLIAGLKEVKAVRLEEIQTVIQAANQADSVEEVSQKIEELKEIEERIIPQVFEEKTHGLLPVVGNYAYNILPVKVQQVVVPILGKEVRAAAIAVPVPEVNNVIAEVAATSNIEAVQDVLVEQVVQRLIEVESVVAADALQGASSAKRQIEVVNVAMHAENQQVLTQSVEPLPNSVKKAAQTLHNTIRTEAKNIWDSKNKRGFSTVVASAMKNIMADLIKVIKAIGKAVGLGKVTITTAIGKVNRKTMALVKAIKKAPSSFVEKLKSIRKGNHSLVTKM